VGVDGANPYSPPQAPIADGGRDAGADLASDEDSALPPWRLEGRTLFARHGATLPDICLFDGEPTKPAQRIRYALSWTPIWFKFVVFTAPIVAALAYTALRRSSTVHLALGAAGRRRRRLVLALILAAVLDGLVILQRSADLGAENASLLALLLVGLVVVALAIRPFRVVKIDRRYACLRLRPRAADAFARLPPPSPPPA
jgi:hypothetical protein